MEIVKAYLTKNDCYKAARKLTKVKGIVKHSTGVNNPNLLRYIGTHKDLGTNNGNHWNKTGVYKCVHFMIGKDKNGNVKCFQTLPLNYQCWGCGTGSKGSYNQTHIQYEILEDDLKDKTYFTKAFALARELDAYLCKQYNLKASAVVSHAEAHKQGYASNHGDCDIWLKKFGRSMADERAAVDKLLKSGSSNSNTKPNTSTTPATTTKPATNTTTAKTFKVMVKVASLNVRKGPGLLYKTVSTVKKGEVYTIVEQKGNWGRLKSGAGWINITSSYVKKL